MNNTGHFVMKACHPPPLAQTSKNRMYLLAIQTIPFFQHLYTVYTFPLHPKQILRKKTAFPLCNA